MSIIGLISSFFIRKAIAANKAMRVQITKNNIEIAMISLASFVANHNRLPRPSLDDSGRENSAAETDLCSFVGRIPFDTLKIPPRNTFDGKGKPLIYIVEPHLTYNFTSIYERATVNNYFCRGIANPGISINGMGNLPPDIIALVIDINDNLPRISEKINLDISPYTYWISRDRLLMQYLKNCPCKKGEFSFKDR
jgi:hypothetical protein